MTRKWFTPENTTLSARDCEIANRAARHLVDDHNMSPTDRWLMSVRMHYQPGRTAADVIRLVNQEREAMRDTRP